jgi:hypothetical protein
MQKLASEPGFKVSNDKSAGVHGANSAHYNDGNQAFDLNFNGDYKEEKAQLLAKQAELEAAGYVTLLEEKGQGKSTGLHLHVQTGYQGLGQAAQDAHKARMAKAGGGQPVGGSNRVDVEHIIPLENDKRDPNLRAGDYAKTGSYGLTQITAETRKALGVDEARYASDPKYQAEMGQKYLDQIAANHPTWTAQQVATAYQQGPGNVEKAIKNGGENWIAQLGPYGQRYAKKYAAQVANAGKTSPTGAPITSQTQTSTSTQTSQTFNPSEAVAFDSVLQPRKMNDLEIDEIAREQYPNDVLRRERLKKSLIRENEIQADAQKQRQDTAKDKLQDWRNAHPKRDISYAPREYVRDANPDDLARIAKSADPDKLSISTQTQTSTKEVELVGQSPRYAEALGNPAILQKMDTDKAELSGLITKQEGEHIRAVQGRIKSNGAARVAADKKDTKDAVQKGLGTIFPNLTKYNGNKPPSDQEDDLKDYMNLQQLQGQTDIDLYAAEQQNGKPLTREESQQIINKNVLKAFKTTLGKEEGWLWWRRTVPKELVVPEAQLKRALDAGVSREDAITSFKNQFAQGKIDINGNPTGNN